MRVIITDRMDHASIIDACRLSKGKGVWFKHNDIEHLEQVCSDWTPMPGKMVVIDGVFSMEGDLTESPGHCELKKNMDSSFSWTMPTGSVLWERTAGVQPSILVWRTRSICCRHLQQIFRFSRWLCCRGSQSDFLHQTSCPCSHLQCQYYPCVSCHGAGDC